MPTSPQDGSIAVSHGELKKLKWQRPFQPFRITTIDNEAFDVVDPGLFILGKDEVTIGLPHPSEPPPAAKELIWLGFEHIAHVAPIEST